MQARICGGGSFGSLHKVAQQTLCIGSRNSRLLDKACVLGFRRGDAPRSAQSMVIARVEKRDFSRGGSGPVRAIWASRSHSNLLVKCVIPSLSESSRTTASDLRHRGEIFVLPSHPPCKNKGRGNLFVFLILGLRSGKVGGTGCRWPRTHWGERCVGEYLSEDAY